MIRLYKTTPSTTEEIIELLNANGFKCKKNIFGVICPTKHLRLKHTQNIVEIHYMLPVLLIMPLALIVALLIIILGVALFSFINFQPASGLASGLALAVTYISWSFVSGFFQARISGKEKNNIYRIAQLLQLSSEK